MKLKASICRVVYGIAIFRYCLKMAKLTLHNATKIVNNVRTARGYIKFRGWGRGAGEAGFFPEQRTEIEPIADELEFHGWPSKMTG